MTDTIVLQPRPPVVVILGHVDHGKTTLLDYIRKTNIAAREAGAITQHIGAYQVKIKNQTITFIDTPGHEAFGKMRSRGVKVADLAVLVVAADDGVMPQTKESIKFIQEAQTPFLVAINKIDIPGVSEDKIKRQLAESGVLAEGYGGNTVCALVSAKTGAGIENLLEMLLLLAEMEELKADPKKAFTGVVIEVKIDSRKGPTAIILVKEGTLKQGEEIEIEGRKTKIRAMFNESGQVLMEAGPSRPVEILGLEVLPAVGAKVTGIQEEAQKREMLSETVEKQLAVSEGETRLKIILKADVSGSLEAILSSLSENILLIDTGLGDILESDILLAKTTGAQVFGFNVKVLPMGQKLAKEEEIKVRTYKIIYELLEEIEKQVLRLLEPTLGEEILGKARIIAEFAAQKQRVAGARVLEGKIPKGGKIHLFREEKIIGESQLVSLKHEKEDIREAGVGVDFGAVFSPPLDFKIGDVIIAYIVKESDE